MADELQSFEQQAKDLTPETGVVFKKPFDNTQEGKFFIKVFDLFPQMGADHREGRRVVSVSIEMFGELCKLAGYEPVNPATGQTKSEEEADNE